MSNNEKTIIDMVSKYGKGDLYYMGKCREFNGQYVILEKNNDVFLATKTQKEMIEKLSRII